MQPPSDDHPELAGYEPHGDKPLRSRHLVTVMRVVVILGVLALVLPGLLITANTASNTADRACAAYTEYFAPDATAWSVRFELFGPSVGWNCYATFFGGDEVLVQPLGLIPAGPALPDAPLERS